MSFKNVDIDSALRRLAEARIEEAMREGKFDNLPGAGKPLDLEPLPAGESARLAWWATRIFKQNDFTPEEFRWRKQLDSYRAELGGATTERRVRAIVAAHNDLVQQINTLGTNVLQSGVAPLSLDVELRRLHERATPATSSRVCPIDVCKCDNPRAATYCRRCGSALSE